MVGAMKIGMMRIAQHIGLLCGYLMLMLGMAWICLHWRSGHLISKSRTQPIEGRNSLVVPLCCLHLKLWYLHLSLMLRVMAKLRQKYNMLSYNIEALITIMQ